MHPYTIGIILPQDNASTAFIVITKSPVSELAYVPTHPVDYPVSLMNARMLEEVGNTENCALASIPMRGTPPALISADWRRKSAGAQLLTHCTASVRPQPTVGAVMAWRVPCCSVALKCISGPTAVAKCRAVFGAPLELGQSPQLFRGHKN